MEIEIGAFTNECTKIIGVMTNMVNKIEDVQIIIAGTWIAAMFGYIYGDLISFYSPGHLEKIIDGEMPIGSDISLLGVAILMSLPGLMVFLSLVVPYKFNRVLNIIVGVFHVFVMGTTLILPLTGDTFSYSLYYSYLAVLEISFNILAIWYAWNWQAPDN
ncbi:MAG: DUF6326 family protein [Promethearchaeota archaeon]